MYSPNSHKLTIVSNNNMTLYFSVINISECLLIVADESYTQIDKHVYAG